MKSHGLIAAYYRGRQRKISISMAVSLILAAAAQMQAPTAVAAESDTTDTESGGLEEVTVTATRHTESVLNVPYNISAITGTDLKNAGAIDVQSLTTMVPGLQAPNGGLRGNQLPQFTIRGLNVSPNGESSTTPGGEAPLVSVYSDNTPLEANLKMTDIAQVEVLRGPQSTLYGSGAVGGTIRLIHNQPDTTQTIFQVTADTSATQHAEGPSGSIDTIFNIPISDSIALRGSAGWEGDSGYTDARSLVTLDSAEQPVLANPASPLTSGLTYHQQNGVDDGTVWYTRLAGLYKFSDAGQANLTIQHQQTIAGDYPYEEPGLSYEQDRDYREPLRNVTDLASFDVSQDLGFATISSTSSYTNQSERSVDDLSGLIEELNPILYGNYPRVSSPLYDRDRIKTMTEEARLASDGDGPLKWVAGMWYSYQYAENSNYETIPGYASWAALPGSGAFPGGCTVYDATTCPNPTLDDVLLNELDATPPSDPIPGHPADGVFYYFEHSRFHDFSPLFGEVSYHITPKWQVTGGGRVILQRFAENIGQQIPVCGAICSQSQTDPAGSVAASSETTFHREVYKANTSYEIAPDTLLYYTWSQGFRRGGANGLPYGSCLFCVPASQLSYKPDLAVNNEVGVKGRISKFATYTVTLFNIDWEQPQISASEPVSGLGFISNAGSARSRGLESEVTVQAGSYTRLTLGYSYTDATLTSNFNVGNGAFVGEDGDRLPGVSKEQASAALDFEAPPIQEFSFHAHADVAYRSDFWTETPRSEDAALLSGYVLVNTRAGVSIGDKWRIDAYLNNVTGSQGISGYTYTAAFLPHNNAYLVSRPRTVGIQINYSLAQKR